MLQLTVFGLYMVFSGITGSPAMPVTETLPVTSETVQIEKKESELEVIVDTENYVRGHFRDLPLLAEIARCESTFRQFDENGEILRGKSNSNDVGVMQINEKYHLKTANKLGLDIYTIEGNMAYARYLYDREGARPWMASSSCWSQPRELAMR